MSAITGAFLFDGLSSSGIDKVNEAWGQGFLELVQELTRYAENLDKLDSAAVKSDLNYPGVFEYEVILILGGWFGSEVINNKGTPPTWKEWHEKAIKTYTNFFARGSSTAERSRINAIFRDVKFNDEETGVSTMKLDISTIDWKLLRKQKEWLIKMSEEHSEALGLLSLVDHLQDSAVGWGPSEITVFGKYEDREVCDGSVAS